MWKAAARRYQGVEISYNTVEDRGGGVGISSGNVTLGGGTIIFIPLTAAEASMSDRPGALFTQLGGQVGNNFAMTTSVGAGGSGGGLYIGPGQAVLRDGQIDLNHGLVRRRRSTCPALRPSSCRQVESSWATRHRIFRRWPLCERRSGDAETTADWWATRPRWMAAGYSSDSGSFSQTLGVIVSNQAYGAVVSLFDLGTLVLNGAP